MQQKVSIIHIVRITHIVMCVTPLTTATGGLRGTNVLRSILPLPEQLHAPQKIGSSGRPGGWTNVETGCSLFLSLSSLDACGSGCRELPINKAGDLARLEWIFCSTVPQVLYQIRGTDYPPGNSWDPGTYLLPTQHCGILDINHGDIRCEHMFKVSSCSARVDAIILVKFY